MKKWNDMTKIERAAYKNTKAAFNFEVGGWYNCIQDGIPEAIPDTIEEAKEIIYRGAIEDKYFEGGVRVFAAPEEIRFAGKEFIMEIIDNLFEKDDDVKEIKKYKQWDDVIRLTTTRFAIFLLAMTRVLLVWDWDVQIVPDWDRDNDGDRIKFYVRWSSSGFESNLNFDRGIENKLKKAERVQDQLTMATNIARKLNACNIQRDTENDDDIIESQETFDKMVDVVASFIRNGNADGIKDFFTLGSSRK